MAVNQYVDLPEATGGNTSTDVNIHDSSGNPINSTGGSVNVDVTNPVAVDLHDAAGNPITSTGGALNVNSTGSSVVTGTVTSNEAGLDAFQTSQYTVGTTAVQFAPTPLADRSSISLRVIATGTNIIYVGNSSSVTISTGYPLFNGDTLQMDLTPSGMVWGIATAPGQTMTVLEIA